MSDNELFLKNKFSEVKKFIPANSKILDIGCNDGKLKDFLDNPVYYAVDVDKNMINQLTKQGINAKAVDLNKDSLPFKEEKFDYVLLLDILEHL